MVTAALAGGARRRRGRRLRDRRRRLQGDGRGRRPATLLDGEAGREAGGGARLRPPRLRLRGAADRDPGAAARRDALRDQPRPDPADARRRLAGDRLDPGRGRDRVAAPSPRSAASPSATSSSSPASGSPAPSGWRWSATGSPPTSRAAGGPAWRPSSSSAAPRTREEAEARRAAARPRRRRPRGAAAMSDGGASAAPAFRPGLAFAGIFAVTFCGLLAVGAVLPVLPRYVHGPLDGGNIAVGVVVGSYAATGLLLRPVAGRYADRRGRRPTVLVGSLLVAVSGFLYLLPLGVPGLIAARLVLGAGEGTVFTAGSAWIVDLAPPDRRGRVIGLYGLAVWGALSVGPLIGELLLHASGYTLVWLFAGTMPLVGAAIATPRPRPLPAGRLARARAPSADRARGGAARARRWRWPRSATPASPPSSSSTSTPAASATARSAFGAFATMVVLTRLFAGDLPDRVGPARVATGAALVEAVGLATIGIAQSLPVAIAGVAGDGRRLLAALPLALADRRRTGPRDPARRRARHLHRLLRRRRRDRRAAGRDSPRRSPTTRVPSCSPRRSPWSRRRRSRFAIARRAGGARRPAAASEPSARRRAASGSPRPIRPLPSESSDSALPIPFGRGRVTASTQIHSPSGMRSRLTVRSTLMKRYRRQSRTALIPLPTSAMTRVRCSGEGSSPATRGTRWRIQTFAGPGSRKPPLERPPLHRRVVADVLSRSGRTRRPALLAGRAAARRGRSTLPGRSSEAVRIRQPLARTSSLSPSLGCLDQLHATAGANDRRLDRDRADRHRVAGSRM